MIQAAMYFALGLLVAGLIALVVTPAIWRRAMRLARRRIEATVPLTRDEIDADKDQLRASFAVTNRRLELETARLRDKAAEGAIEVGRREEAIANLSRTNATLTAAVAELEARAAELAAATRAAQSELTLARADLEASQSRVAQSEIEILRLEATVEARELMTEELRLEMVARSTEIANLGHQLNDRAASEAEIVAARDRAGAELEAERARIAAEQKRVAVLEASFAALQTERTGRLAEIERRTAQMRDLEADIAALRSERDAAIAALGAAESRSSEGDNVRKALAATEAANADLTLRLSALEDDLSAVRAENAELRRVAGAEWESEREETRRLRERLGEIAAGVARMAVQSGVAPADTGDAAAAIPLTQRPGPATTEGDGSLAERLRALHHAGGRR